MTDHITCPLCGVEVKQVASATLSLALWQHVWWVCEEKKALTKRGSCEHTPLAEQAGQEQIPLDTFWTGVCGRCGDPHCFGGCEVGGDDHPKEEEVP
jgi:hypothetical protein